MWHRSRGPFLRERAESSGTIAKASHWAAALKVAAVIQALSCNFGEESHADQA